MIPLKIFGQALELPWVWPSGQQEPQLGLERALLPLLLALPLLLLGVQKADKLLTEPLERALLPLEPPEPMPRRPRKRP